MVGISEWLRFFVHESYNPISDLPDLHAVQRFLKLSGCKFIEIICVYVHVIICLQKVWDVVTFFGIPCQYIQGLECHVVVTVYK